MRLVIIAPIFVIDEDNMCVLQTLKTFAAFFQVNDDYW